MGVLFFVWENLTKGSRPEFQRNPDSLGGPVNIFCYMKVIKVFERKTKLGANFGETVKALIKLKLEGKQL